MTPAESDTDTPKINCGDHPAHESSPATAPRTQSGPGRAGATVFAVLFASAGFTAPGAFAQESGATGSTPTLIVWGTMDPPAIEPIIRQFEAIHSAVHIQYEETNSIELYSRFVSAAGGRQATADLVMSSAIDLQTKLVNDGHALSHRTPHAKALPKWAIWRDEAFAFSYEPVVTVYNSALLEPEHRPSNRYRLEELLRTEPERFGGKVGTYDPARSGTGYLYLTQDIEQSPIVWELIRAFGQAGVRLFATSREIIDAVVSGDLLVGYNVVGSYAFARAHSEPALDVVMPEDYTLVVARTAFVSRHGRHPAFARQFLDYLLSREGQLVVSGPAGLFPIRADVGGESMSDLSRETFGGARAVRMGPGLLVYVDRLKREKVLRRWRGAIQAGPPLP